MGENITTKGLKIRSVRAISLRAGQKITQLFVNERRRKARKRLAEKSDINKGLTKAQRKAVERIENQIRDLDTERVVVVDKNGKIIGRSTTGTDSNTRLPEGSYEDSVITHNHPGTVLGKATRYGTSLSWNDIVAASFENAAAIRAVAGDYTYSVRRPKKGWPNDEVIENFAREWDYLWDYGKLSIEKYINAGKGDFDKKRRRQRSTTLAAHHINKLLFEKYGFEYTRKRTRSRKR